MSTRRLLVANLAMWSLGLAALVGFVWAVAWLDDVPVEIAAQADVPDAVAAEDPLAALAAGTARSAGTAIHELERGRRSAATHAIDGAMRAGEVGHDASHGPVKEAFTIGLHAIVQARESLHNGTTPPAIAHLRDAVEALGDAVEPARAIRARVPPAAVWTGFDGAALINANGARLGEVEAISSGDGGSLAVVHVGGASDVLGLFEIGGRTIRIPADRLLYGPRRSLGATLVVAPIEGTDVDALAAG